MGAGHDLRNTGSPQLICIIVGQDLGFDDVNYPERNKRMYRRAGQLADLVDIAVVSHPRLFPD